MISEVLGTHIVQDHVYAIRRDFPYGGWPVTAVGERVICPDRAAVVELVLATCSRDHGRLEAFGVLNGKRADAAGATMHEEPVTLGEANELDVGVDRCGDLDDARSSE